MQADRKHLENIEEKTLAPYALKSSQSRGRAHPEPEPAYRTAFQRDRDRIVHAAAFRRLEYKTQVFVNDAGDYYRTRLTHSLEVSQIGRTIARALGANEDLVETICLAHDLGHPPFGHAGEHALDAQMQGVGGFNHNYQSYRVVTELERRYDRWTGLNLTYETLEAIAKHETDFDFGAVTDFDVGTRGSLEAQIADISDELAYNAHDLDDGLCAGLLQPKQLKNLEIWQRLVEGSRWDGTQLDSIARHHLIRELVGLLVSDLIYQTEQNLQDLAPDSPSAIQNHSQNVAAYTPEIGQLNKALKAFLYTEMYGHYQVIRMQQRAERFVSDLFRSYLEEPRQLPPDDYKRIENDGVHRVVADYIASLTDRSALREYRRLFDPSAQADSF